MTGAGRVQGGCSAGRARGLPLDVGRAGAVQAEELVGRARRTDSWLAVDALGQVGQRACGGGLHLAELGGGKVEQQVQRAVGAHLHLRVVDGGGDVGNHRGSFRLDVGVRQPSQRVHGLEPAVA